jgi:hypothetical protein
MTRINFCLFILLLSFIFSIKPYSSFAWGFLAHKRINRIAVYTLPPEMLGFYKLHIEYLTEHAVDPDKRRYAVKEEGPRHYIDLDHYGSSPFDSLPQIWKMAYAKYTEDTLLAYGINPWYIETMLHRLTKSFLERNTKEILHLSADIGHYIADAHVPLHTTQNYNGQMTGQIGIHAFWESRIPELFGDTYDYFVGKCKYIETPSKVIWIFIRSSYEAVDSVLWFEKQLNAATESDKKYSLEKAGQIIKSVYSTQYAREYNELLDHMTERRIRMAILAVGSFWFTAWVNAGQPDLEKMDPIDQSKTPEALDLEGSPKDKNTPIQLKEKGHTE